jgi:C-terminal processing protease CtpA/Prc
MDAAVIDCSVLMKNALAICLWLATLGSGFSQLTFPIQPGVGGGQREIEEFGGIGAVLNKDANAQTIFVAGVLPGLAADKAGILQNDIISEVGGVSTYGKDLADVVALIRGPVGSTVDISIVRDPTQPPLRLVIVREGVQATK